jgi:formylmethanofuran dehydrogenase subunit E
MIVLKRHKPEGGLSMRGIGEYFDLAAQFHGHKCPAMPMGLRAGLEAMKALGVERAKDKELIVESETGEGHAAGCFVDGIMAATGGTYGKGILPGSATTKWPSR